jgi:hypothetical protein
MSKRIVAFVLLCATALPASASDWGNYGGNAARNGASPEIGPSGADLLWQDAGDFSIISWHPFVLEGRVFTIREAGFPQNGGAANDALVAYDLDTGAELWRVTLPFGGDTSLEWIAWIAGANSGRVYASRSQNGSSQPIRAYDAASGAFLWASAASTQAWAHDGVVFAPDGDLIVGDFSHIYRIDATDGSTVWSTVRLCPVSGNCGAALSPSGLFVDEPRPGPTNRIAKYDLATGAFLYATADFPGFTTQNTPFVSRDGLTVYFSRTQNNVAVDFLYAFEDTGTALVERWHVPVRWTTSHEHGIGPDDTLYAFSQADELIRIDPVTGTTLDSTAPLAPLGSPNLSPKTVVDANGTVYVSNGWASTPATSGRVWAYSSDLSQQRFVLSLDRQNAGGPVLAEGGTLVVCDRQAVRAYRTRPAASFCAGDGTAPAACPCGNAGLLGRGCDNAQGTGGVALTATGDPAANSVVLHGAGFPPASAPTVLAIRSPSLESPAVPFGDGLRCVGVAGLVRFGATAAAGGLSTHPVNHGAGPGTFHYQLWYRNTPATFCDPAAAFNLSSGVAIVWP